MNIEAYDIDSLRKLVRSLQNENTVLKAQLQKANIPYEDYSHFEEKIENLENYDPDQGERIINPEYITDDMAKRYFAMFWGRQDVFAKRGKNGGYFPHAIIVGITLCALNKEAKKFVVKIVRTQNGQNLLQKRLLNI